MQEKVWGIKIELVYKEGRFDTTKGDYLFFHHETAESFAEALKAIMSEFKKQARKSGDVHLRVWQFWEHRSEYEILVRISKKWATKWEMEYRTADMGRYEEKTETYDTDKQFFKQVEWLVKYHVNNMLGENGIQMKTYLQAL